MHELVTCDVCIIGAGSGGLTMAAGASQMGARVVLIEKSAMGGDCLNTGCVPSKALLAAAEKAQSIREASAFGITSTAPNVDMQKVHQHVHEVMAAIAPNDSQERFEALGVHVIRAAASFIDRRHVRAGDVRVKARYFVIATGSSPFVPPIPGLDRVNFLTNENLFDVQQHIEHLMVIGGGPIGMEMAQAMRRLGARVSVLEAVRLLSKDDPECAAIVIERMRREGVDFIEGGRDLRLAPAADGGIDVHCRQQDEDVCLHGSHILIATGRRANVYGLNLEQAGVDYSERGILVDQRMRSSNRRIFAIGDVTGSWQFTHIAAYQAGIALRNILFGLPAKAHDHAVPWVSYTDPELAQVGMQAGQAEQQRIPHKILRWRWQENDRAQAERRTEGLVKVVVRPNGRILGATIVGMHAGELIQPWVLAIEQKLSIKHMAASIVPYPTLAEVNKRVAGSFYSDALFSPRMRRLVQWLLRLRY